jgi:hypothetical protein
MRPWRQEEPFRRRRRRSGCGSAFIRSHRLLRVYADRREHHDSSEERVLSHLRPHSWMVELAAQLYASVRGAPTQVPRSHIAVLLLMFSPNLPMLWMWTARPLAFWQKQELRERISGGRGWNCD